MKRVAFLCGIVTAAILVGSYFMGRTYLIVNAVLCFLPAALPISPHTRTQNANHLFSMMVLLLKWRSVEPAGASQYCKEVKPELGLLWSALEEEMPTSEAGTKGVIAAKFLEWGDYSLSMPVDSLSGLQELTEQEYRFFRRFLRGEVTYHAPATNHLGYRWDMMVSLVEGELCRLGASVELYDQREGIELIRSVVKHCEMLLGTATKEKEGFFVWNTEDGNVIVHTGFIGGSTGVNVVVTSSSVRGKPLR